MTNPTPHGQVPEALIDLIDAYAETRHRCGGIYNAKTEAARNAVIEALSEAQALSAAPAAAAGPSLQHLRDLLYTAQRTTGDAQAQAIAEARIALSGIMTAQEPAVLASRAWPKVSGVSRDEGHSRALLVFFAAEPADDEMRAVHDTLAAAPTAKAAPRQEAQPNYVVSLVVVKEIPTGVNTQNKLYTVNAASADEAVGKAVLQMHNDFPEHRLHTACFVAIPAQPAPQPAPDCHHRPPCDECAALAAQGGKT